MKATSLDDTIAAISTPGGTGGIGIVRLSGKHAISIAKKIFIPIGGQDLGAKKSHTITYGNIVDPEDNSIIDEALLSIMIAPKTYTRENIVEINCHGGFVVVQRILEIVINNGARIAEPGEFTKRAFLNGRIDLTQAEAVIDIINSKTDMARQAAVNQLGGNLRVKISSLRDRLLSIVAALEVAIDYPEHDMEDEGYDRLYTNITDILAEANAILDTSKQGKIIRDGISVVILGKPNVGKSSLLNYLIDEDRAIVTHVPGTTRDVLEEYVNIEGIPVKIMDTAGIRDTDDIVEKIGVDKSREYADKSDLILAVFDISRPLEDEDLEILNLIKDKKALAILNKTDLKHQLNLAEIYAIVNKENIISLSVVKGEGIEKIGGRIKNMFISGNLNINQGVMINNIRQKTALLKAVESLKKSLETIESRMPEDFVSMDIMESIRSLNEITGDNIEEDLIDKIFSEFCLGK